MKFQHLHYVKIDRETKQPYYTDLLGVCVTVDNIDLVNWNCVLSVNIAAHTKNKNVPKHFAFFIYLFMRNQCNNVAGAQHQRNTQMCMRMNTRENQWDHHLYITFVAMNDRW